MCVMVTGAAGYVGSHMVHELRQAGHRVVAVDDLSSGFRDAVSTEVPFVVGRIGDRTTMRQTIRDHGVRDVIHFAGSIQVGESVDAPRKYYRNNVVESLELLESIIEEGVERFIFSSTAAVYGTPVVTPIPEDHSTIPTNPYGDTKLAIERALFAYAKAYGLATVCLRYFNAAGAHVEARLGERHQPETHLIPILIDALLGHRGPATIYGTDYETVDGTCVRDYVHVRDLAAAHLAALRYLSDGGRSTPINLGSGTGNTVLEVVRMLEARAGRAVPVRLGPRRAGDPPALVANIERAAELLGWRPTRDLETIIDDALRWHSQPANHQDVSHE